MTLCIVDGGHCNCQPDEGVVCDKLPKKIRDYVLTAVKTAREDAVEANEPRVSAEEWKRVAESQSELLKICAKTEALKDAEIAELQERMLVLLALQLRQLESEK